MNSPFAAPDHEVNLTGVHCSIYGDGMTDEQYKAYLQTLSLREQWCWVIMALAPFVIMIVMTVLGCTVWSH